MILKEMEKARKALSADDQVTIDIPNMYEDEAYERDLSLNEFQELIKSKTEQFTTLLQNSLQNSGYTADQINEIQLLGDVTRTQIFYAAVQQIFQK